MTRTIDTDPTLPVIEPFECELAPQHVPGVVLWDVSDRMPRHARKRYVKRTQRVRRLYVHQSAGDGPAGIAGAIASAAFCVNHRNMPGMPYHLWIPTADLFDSQGRRVVLRTQRTEIRSHHTGDDELGAANGQPNNHGLSVTFQGNHASRPPSAHQKACFPAVAFWLLAQPDTDRESPIAWHAIASLFGGDNKRSCPGRGVLDWLLPWMRSEDLPVPRGT